jgi:hypothetical protein
MNVFQITEFGASPRASCNLGELLSVSEFTVSLTNAVVLQGYYPIHEAAKNASSKTMEVFLQVENV